MHWEDALIRVQFMSFESSSWVFLTAGESGISSLFSWFREEQSSWMRYDWLVCGALLSGFWGCGFPWHIFSMFYFWRRFFIYAIKFKIFWYVDWNLSLFYRDFRVRGPLFVFPNLVFDCDAHIREGFKNCYLQGNIVGVLGENWQHSGNFKWLVQDLNEWCDFYFEVRILSKFYVWHICDS